MREVEGIRLYTTAEVADLLGVTRQTVRAYIKTKALPAKRFGKGFSVTGADLKAFVLGAPATPAASTPSQGQLP
jgi:excisionase family DNA binding protein